MKPYISPLTIEKIVTGAYSKGSKYAIIDSDGERLMLLESLFDAAICLRFMLGKSMSRTECDLAEQLLKEHDENNTVSEGFTSEKSRFRGRTAGEEITG